MTAEEFIDKNTHLFKLENSYRRIGDIDEDIRKLIIEFAKIKCKKLLEIAAEKAETKTQKKSQYGKYRKWQNVKEGEEFDLFQYEMKCSVNKDSILNAVDLDEFIK